MLHTGPDDEKFWELPPVSKKTYSPPSQGRNTDTIPLSIDEPDESRQEAIPPRDPSTATAAQGNFRPTRPADRTYRTAAYATSREYQNRVQNRADGGTFGFREEDRVGTDIPPQENGSSGDLVEERDGEGWLIRHVVIRRWINDFSFYATFGRDALVSHQKVGKPTEPVACTSFVPQYSQMNSRQLDYYLWFRDNARQDNFLPADFAYVLLYIYEILNLPDQIPTVEGIERLCLLWAHYRKVYPKLDAYLCEWIPDYALIHGVALPGVLEPFLSEIVRKAQFKEFFLDNMCPPGGRLSHRAIAVLAGVLLETYSDYDYTLSRYYTGGNQAAYDKCIPEALTAALEQAYAEGRGMFATDRLYRLTRDSYCGAIIHTGNKRRIDVAFHSCIRSPDTRRYVTGIVKYAENRLRGRLKIKSKLNASDIAPADKAQVDAYFGPEEVPVAKKKVVEEEAYMQLYDVDTTGFDFSVAKQIEDASWRNTDRLTAAEPGEPVVPEMPIAEEPAAQEVVENVPVAAQPMQVPVEEKGQVTAEPSVRDAVLALLGGQFESYCRAHGLFPGKVAEQINEVFLDVTGDILVEADGNRYSLIEDYREDAEAWSKMET